MTDDVDGKTTQVKEAWVRRGDTELGSPDGTAMAAVLRGIDDLVVRHDWPVPEPGVTGSRRRDYERAVRLIEQGTVEVAPLVTHRFTVADAREAIEATADSEGLKIAVVPDTAV